MERTLWPWTVCQTSDPANKRCNMTPCDLIPRSIRDLPCRSYLLLVRSLPFCYTISILYIYMCVCVCVCVCVYVCVCVGGCLCVGVLLI